MKILFATENQGKLTEARAVLTPLGFEVVGSRLPLTEPDAGTVEEVAKQKIAQAVALGYDRVMVDDAGIYFAAYEQFPGILTKRIFQGIGYRGIAKLLAGEDRSAWFEGTVAVCWNGQVFSCSAITKGRIMDPLPTDLDSAPGFPFDAIFVPDGETTVLNQLPEEKRLFYSYRRKALEKMARWIFEQEAKAKSKFQEIKKENSKNNIYMI